MEDRRRGGGSAQRSALGIVASANEGGKHRSTGAVTGVLTRVKMDELFVLWLSMPDAQAKIHAAMNAVHPSAERIQIPPSSPPGHLRHQELMHEPSTPPRSPKSPKRPKGAKSPQRDPFGSSLPGPVTLSQPPALLQANSAKKRDEIIPPFYFPKAKKVSVEKADEEAQSIKRAFTSKPGMSLSKDQFMTVTKEICGFPSYLNSRFFGRVDIDKQGVVSLSRFMQYWNTEMKSLDETTRWFNILKSPANDYILPSDFDPLVQIILQTHPGLEFLKNTPEFQERYAETVVLRIFYKVNRSESGKISHTELKKSNLIQVMSQLDSETDINKVLEYFSYEHFYVLYCKFWELDTDHDHVISRDDLQKYGSHSLTHRVIDRIFSQVPKKFTSTVPGTMNYLDFCWFLLSEEDKTTETSVEYWFRVLDIDNDGYVSLYEMEFFYVEQLHRMNCLSIEVVQFQDILCQLLDMLKPKDVKCMTISDFKRCKLACHVFNILFNLNKFIAYEQRDPFSIRQEMNSPEKTDWDRFARAEYDLLAAEEENDDYADD